MKGNSLGSMLARAATSIQASDRKDGDSAMSDPNQAYQSFTNEKEQRSVFTEAQKSTERQAEGDFQQPNWYEIRPKEKGPERRAYHSSFMYQNKVYVHGGEDWHEGVRSNMYYIDLDFMGDIPGRVGTSTIDPQWFPICTDTRYKQAPGALAHHTTVCHNGFAYLYGGQTGAGRPNLQTYRFEMALQKWVIGKSQGDHPGPRDDHSAIVYNECMIIFGGFADGKKTNDVHSYDLTTGEWCKFDLMEGPSARSGHTATLYHDQMIVFGGIDQNLNRLNDTWSLDFKLMKWTRLTIRISDFYLPRPRSGHSASIYKDQYLVVFGGMTAVTKELDDVVALDIQSKEWIEIVKPNQTKPPEKVIPKLMSKFGKQISSKLGLGKENSLIKRSTTESKQGPILVRRNTKVMATEGSAANPYSNKREQALRSMSLQSLGGNSATAWFQKSPGLKNQQSTLSRVDSESSLRKGERSTELPQLNRCNTVTTIKRRNTSRDKSTGKKNGKSTFNPYSDLPEVAVNLVSPTSDRMKNSFIIVNGATKNMESFRRSQAMRKSRQGVGHMSNPQLVHAHTNIDDSHYNIENQEVSTPHLKHQQSLATPQLKNALSYQAAHFGEGNKVMNSHILQNKRPSARDGHSGLIFIAAEDIYLLIFGGDRHGMPFNDLHILDLKSEFARHQIY